MKQELKSGIKEFYEVVEQFENGEINFVELTCRLWNKAYSIGCSEQLQQADVSGSLGFDEGYSKGYSDAQREAAQEIREHYHPNDR